MFVDGRSLSEGETVYTDVCIIGAGAAGITLAHELSDQAFRIALVESGGFEFEENTQALYKGTTSGEEYFPLETMRLRYFGGSTNHWSGRCKPLKENEFEHRPWIPNSGWPFNRAYMEPFYQRASVICELPPYKYDVSFIEKELGLSRLPLDKRLVKTIAFYMSPPTRFGNVYRSALNRSKNISVFLHSNVLEFETSDSADHVNSVRIKCLEGNEYRIFAKQFILATGGIENPRLLLASNRIQTTGLGNGYDVVGRYFLEHPYLEAARFLPSNPNLDLRLYAKNRRALDDGMPCDIWLTLPPEVTKKMQIANYNVELVSQQGIFYGEGSASKNYLVDSLSEGKWPDDIDVHIGNIIQNLDLIAGRAIHRFRKRFFDEPDPVFYKMITSTEVVPNRDSRITLSSERDSLGMNRVDLHIQYSELDYRTVSAGTELVARELGRAGLGRLKVILGADNNERDFGKAAYAHHMGTTRMHTDPRHGVVDPNCKVHSVNNLYIAGSSVFPINGAGVPTLTIVALAVRLADHIKKLMG